MDPLPGAEEMSAETSQAIAAAWRQRDRKEPVRTKHLRDDGSPRYSNRLLLETSPYLRQHSHNPVNWYRWGDEAFETARRLNRPVLLSIGYSTCHWCHVMEEESFEDEEIARYLNEHYVAIKVDREQRPELDSIYMTAVQALTGRGGWPMTVWLTDDREPFYGGTYFPARDGDRGGSPGFLTLLGKLSDIFQSDPSAVETNATQLATRIREALSVGATGSALPGSDALAAMLSASQRRFDPDNGGPRGAPKFPSAIPVRALLRYQRRTSNQQALLIATRTLEGMATGGIRDHLAGGFHRYSTDANWRVPHFEKMLYDNALLTSAYVEAWQITHREDFADAAKMALAWVEREMTAPDGAFYSATDADSLAPSGERAEGWYFTWTPQETTALLGDGAAAEYNAAYGVVANGNLEGRSVLFAAKTPEAVASDSSRKPEDVNKSLAASRETLRKARNERPAPFRDEKILTAWNGLMISAAARASIAFADDRYRKMASRAADAVLGDFAKTGRLVRTRLGPRTQNEAFLDDYAFLGAALLDLFEAGDGATRLEQAIALDAVLERDFEDKSGGFFMTPLGHEKLLVREKPRSDGAEPSGNSIAILNLLRLAEITSDDRYRARADRALIDLAPLLTSNPLSLGDAMMALDFALDAPKEIVLVSDGDAATLDPLLRVFGSTFVPNSVLLRVAKNSPLVKAAPLTEDKPALDGKPTAYVCEARVCDLPTNNPDVFAAHLARTKTLDP